MYILPLFLRDFRARLRDRSALVLALLAPAALITVLSLLAAGPDVEAIPVGVVTADVPIGTALAQGPLASIEKDGTLKLRSYDDEAALRSAVEDGKVDGGLVVASSGSTVTVLADPGSPVASAILDAVSRSTALTVDGVGHAVHAERQLGGSASPQEIAQRVVAEPSTTQVDRCDRGL